MEVECEWLVLPGGRHEKGPFYVTVKDDTIAAISKDPSASSESITERLTTHLLVPGFVDLHTHGVGECTGQLYNRSVIYAMLTVSTHNHCRW